MRFLFKSKIFFVSLALTYIVLVGVYYFTSVGIRPTTLFFTNASLSSLCFSSSYSYFYVEACRIEIK